MVWALRGATDADVVVPAEFVSICNNKGPFGLVAVTDQDRRLAVAKRSQSVTSGRLKTVYLLQIKTFCWNDRSIAALSPFALISLFLPLTDMSAVTLPRWAIMDKCSS